MQLNKETNPNKIHMKVNFIILIQFRVLQYLEVSLVFL